MFRKLAQIAYHRAAKVVTLSDANRRKQLADGASPQKILIVPNGVKLSTPPSLPPEPPTALGCRRIVPALRVGFVGRVVPIKDVVTFIKACDIALREVPLDVRIIGPDDEDPSYAARCKKLVDMLGRGDSVHFVGRMAPSKIYGDLDVVVLTSFSEGQPLVILEGYVAGIPAIATDVGACREMIEGLEGADRALGPSGIVTRVGNPRDTASALVRLATDVGLRERFGAAGRARVIASYQQTDMIASYRRLYQEGRAS